MVDYEPVPEGYYRTLLEEYLLCTKAELPREELIENSAKAFRAEIMNDHKQSHFLLEGKIPVNDLTAILQKAELQSMKIPEEPFRPLLMSYEKLSIQEADDYHEKKEYEKFYKSIADKILFAEIFENEERYHDMAKWIKNNFDRFVVFHEDRNSDDNYWIRSDQAFLDGSKRFGYNLTKFVEFFGEGFGTTRLHPVMHFGHDAPLFDEEETRTLIDRFYNCMKDINKENMYSKFSGEENNKRLKKYRKNFDDYCIDENPEELKNLAKTASILYSNEYSFMYQGASHHMTVLVPRWTIALQEEFADSWSGSFHPLIRRGLASDAYKEEAFYIKQTRI